MFKKDPRYRQGIYKPINKNKYSGKKDPIYRSSWELKFFRWADKNSNVLKWGSENIIIPYISPLDGKVHRYFVDNFVIFKENNGDIKKYLIEIKPSKSLAHPTPTKGKKKTTLIYEQRTWLVNQSKWTAAMEWAKKNKCEFLIITEKDLRI